MENRTEPQATSRGTTSQADEFLRRARTAVRTEPLPVAAMAALERLEHVFADTNVKAVA